MNKQTNRESRQAILIIPDRSQVGAHTVVDGNVQMRKIRATNPSQNRLLKSCNL